MASYLQNITDQGSLQTPTPQFDFSFLAVNQQKKESQYMQGLSEVASGYNSILSQPVTDEANKVVREKYVKDAQEGLKKLASTDLSLPSNVAQAEALYAPFWQDNIILQDIAYTKDATNKMQKAYSFRDSTDPEQRVLFDPDSVTYIQQALDKLKKANRNPDAYKKLETRDFIPVHDIDADIDAAYKLEGQKGITTTTLNGPNQTVTTNGLQSRDAFKTYYLSKVGDKYDAQIRMKASVQVQRQKDEILRQNPGLDERALNEHFATENMDHLLSSYKGIGDSYQKLTTGFLSEKAAIEAQVTKQQKGILNDSQIFKLKELNSNIKLHSAAATEYYNQYNAIGGDRLTPDQKQKYQKQFMDMAEHPEQYIGNISKAFMADRWAAGMASMSTVEVKANQGWVEYEKVLFDKKSSDLRQAELNATLRGQDLKLYEDTGKLIPGGKTDPSFGPTGWTTTGSSSSTSSTSGGVGTGTGPESGSLLGQDVAHPGHLANGLDIVQQAQNKLAATVHNSIYNPNGVSSALSASSLPRTDIINFTEWANTIQAGGTPDAEQLVSLNKVKGVLKDAGVTGYQETPEGMQTALLSYVPKAIEKIMASGTDDAAERIGKIIVANVQATGAKDKLLANQKEFDNAVATQVLSHAKEYDKLITTNPDGSKRLISTRDMAKDFPSVSIRQDGNIINYSSRDVAEMWKNGTLDKLKGQLEAVGDKNIKDFNNFIPRNNQVALAQELNKHLYGTSAYQGNDGKVYTEIRDASHKWDNRPLDPNSALGKYGQEGIIGKLQDRASKVIIPQLKDYKDGLIGQEIGYDPSDKKQEQYAVGISKEIANPANVPLIYSQQANNELGEPIKAGNKMSTIRGILENAESVKKYTNGPVRIMTPDGKEAWRVTFKNTDDDAIKDVKNSTFIFPTTDNATTPYLASIPKSTGVFVYSSLLSGQTMTADPITKASGFDYTIKPGMKGIDGRATIAYCSIDRRVPDPLHPGQFKTDHFDFDIPLLVGAGAKSPDELVATMNARVINHISEVIANTRTANANVPVNGMTLAEFNKQESMKVN